MVSDESWKEQEREWNAHLASLEKPDKGGLDRNELLNLIDEHKKSLEEGQGNFIRVDSTTATNSR